MGFLCLWAILSKFLEKLRAAFGGLTLLFKKRGDFIVTAGVEIGNDLSENMEFPVVVIEGGRYLEFKAKGPMPDSLLSKWKEIWFFLEKQ